MKISPATIVLPLLALAFTLATSLVSRVEVWTPRGQSGNVFAVMLGQGRELFANQFFTMADVYFHSGYYPSIFDKNAEEEKDIVSASHQSTESEKEEENEDFMGRPKDWIDGFGRNFKVTHHTHLNNGNEREILPWLRLAADLDPHKVDVYTVGAFFLREHLNKPDDAEAFLREGLRNNPDSCEILFELGRLYFDSSHDIPRARNVWELGVKKFVLRDPQQQKDSKLVIGELAVNLSHLEKSVGNYPPAVKWLQFDLRFTPNPPAIQAQIDDLQKKIAAQNTPKQ